MGETGMTVAQKLNDAAALKLSSFIHSLAELESYAVARIVTKEGKDPQLLLLAPHIEDEFEPRAGADRNQSLRRLEGPARLAVHRHDGRHRSSKAGDDDA